MPIPAKVVVHGSSKLLCAECDSTFQDSFEYRLHQYYHQKLIKEKGLTATKGTFPCIQCDYQAQDYTTIHRHINQEWVRSFPHFDGPSKILSDKLKKYKLW